MKRICFLGQLFLFCSLLICPCYEFVMGGSGSIPQKSIHEFTVKDSRGRDVDLSIYKGKILIVVNVASKCGHTELNYTQLAELYAKYKNHGLEILAFPCNQFWNQEPLSGEAVEQFACTRFQVQFPVFQKVKVNGPETAPVYRFLKASKSGLWGPKIRWNFTKFLVDRDGHVISRYGLRTYPLAFEGDVKKALGFD